MRSARRARVRTRRATLAGVGRSPEPTGPRFGWLSLVIERVPPNPGLQPTNALQAQHFRVEHGAGQWWFPSTRWASPSDHDFTILDAPWLAEHTHWSYRAL